MDETGKLFNESIVGITILNRADAPGYAVQNNLITGTWVDIYFKGDIPLVITGKITNVEEDMIEITTFPTKDVLFIDFGYKGIPDELNIEKINVRSEPAESIKEMPSVALASMEALASTEAATSEAATSEAATSEAATSEAATSRAVGQQTGNLEELGDIEDDYVLDIEEPSREEIKKLLFRADQIIFGDEELELSLVVDLPESQQRFGIEKQTQDLLDDMLSTVPNIQRTPVVLNNIHQMIDRYKQLRNLYSKFDENGNANMPDIKGADYKTLVEILSKFEQKLHWILPVVKTNKKLYIDGGEEEENDDTITVLELADIRNKEEEILKIYQEGGIPDGENKYVYLMRELNSYSIPFLNPSDTENDLTIQKVNVNINAIAANLDDFNSSVVKFKKGKREDMNQANIVSKRFFEKYLYYKLLPENQLPLMIQLR